MWVNNINPTILDLGPVEIRWYGLVYVFGALLVYWMLEYARKKGTLELSQKEVSDFVVWLLVGVLIGSRLFLILFYDLSYYLSQPWKMIAFWEGGMSFHGGLVGIVVACYLFCRKKNLIFLRMADILSAPLMLALALGRIANFINGELWGTVSNAKWCVAFPHASDGGTLCRHPYQLYDGVKRFVLFGWLLFLGRKTFTAGFIFWNFVLFEGLGRFLLDFFKDEFTYWIFTPGQWMSLVMVVVAVYFFWKNHKEDWKNVF